MRIHTSTLLNQPLYQQPRTHCGAREVLWETLFCSKSRMALRRHRGALLMSLSLSLFLCVCLAHSPTALIALVLCKPSYCCHQSPSSPTFPFISHFPLHFHANSRGDTKKSHVMSFIVMQLVYLSIQGENQWGRPRGMTSPSSKLPLLNQRHVYMVELLAHWP